jgi:hypothetical protein
MMLAHVSVEQKAASASSTALLNDAMTVWPTQVAALTLDVTS